VVVTGELQAQIALASANIHRIPHCAGNRYRTTHDTR